MYRNIPRKPDIYPTSSIVVSITHKVEVKVKLHCIEYRTQSNYLQFPV